MRPPIERLTGDPIDGAWSINNRGNERALLYEAHLEEARPDEVVGSVSFGIVNVRTLTLEEVDVATPHPLLPADPYTTRPDRQFAVCAVH